MNVSNCQPLTSGEHRILLLSKLQREREWAKFVNFVWCKICEKHENRVLDHNVCGPTEDAAEIFVTGTSAVTEFNISMSFFMRLCVFLLVQ